MTNPIFLRKTLAAVWLSGVNQIFDTGRALYMEVLGAVPPEVEAAMQLLSKSFRELFD